MKSQLQYLSDGLSRAGSTGLDTESDEQKNVCKIYSVSTGILYILQNEKSSQSA